MTEPARVRRRWRPRLRAVLVAIHLLILMLPLGGIALLRVYESALVRQTESELVGQGAVLAATYATLLEAERGPAGSDYGVPITSPQARQRINDPFRPRPAGLDLARDPVLPPPDEPRPSPWIADPAARAAGQAISPILEQAQRVTLAGIRVLSPEAVIVASTGDDLGLSLRDNPELAQALGGDWLSQMRRRTPARSTGALDSISRGAGLRVLVAGPVLSGERVVGAVLLMRTPVTVAAALRGKRRELAVAALLMVAATLGLAAFSSWAITQPLANLVAQARRAARGERGSVVPLAHSRTREVAELSDTLSAMAAALEARSDDQRQFATHVSHEFKTPLAAIRGAVELLRDHSDMTVSDRERFLANIDADAERLERLVRRLLTLARAETLRAPAEGTALRPTLVALARRYRERGVTVDIPPLPERSLAIDEEWLDSVLSALVDNALDQGSDRVVIEVEDGVGRLALRLNDNGPGVAPANQARLFEPFFTTGRAAGRTGMGLAIGRAVMRSHGGDLLFQDTPAGACFIVITPLSPPRSFS